MSDTVPLPTPSLVSRIIVLLYGLIAYFIGVAGLACLIAGFGQLLPWGFMNSAPSSYALVADVILVAIWGLIHTVMARRPFKQRLTQFIAEPAERSTYVLVAGITSILLVGLWQPLNGVIWSVADPTLTKVIWGAFVFGWVYLLAATFAINHFDLFGLRQVYLNFVNEPRPHIHFMKRAMYKFSRHPIQAGVLIGIWATPHMTVTQLVLSIGFTVYIFAGLWFEERDLVSHIGEPYEQYRREAGMFLPKFFRPN